MKQIKKLNGQEFKSQKINFNTNDMPDFMKLKMVI